VLRPAAPCRPATHALLDHLAAAGFDGAPRVLAVGPYSETLTYIEGQAAVPPLAEDMLTDDALVSVADQDIADSRRGRALERFRIFLAASGLDRAGRRRVAEAVVANHDWTYAIVTEAAAAGRQGFADHWRMVAESAGRARLWCQRHQRDLIAAAR
jgi:hypothetical protein